MAIQLMQENGEYNIKNQHFLIDEENDLVNLESEYSCSMGDRAELPDGTIYVRHSDNYKIPIVPHQFAPYNSDVSEGIELSSYLPINVDLTQFVPGAEIIVNWNGETYSVTIAEEDYYHFIGYRDRENPTFEIGYFTNGLANGQLIFAYGYNPPAPETVELTVTPLENNNLWEVESSSGWSNLPDTPTANGNYVLQNDVSSGTSSISWGEKGWNVTSSSTVLTNETVTTVSDQAGLPVGVLSYTTSFSADSMAVTFNGVEYECSKQIFSDVAIGYGGVDYNGPNFSIYPFAVLSINGDNLLWTPQEGTYTLKLEVVNKTVTTTSDFDKAVAHTGVGPLVIHIDPNSGVTDRTWQEVAEALAAGIVVICPDLFNGYPELLYAVATLGDPDPYSVALLGAGGSPLGPIIVSLFAETADSYLFFD